MENNENQSSKRRRIGSASSGSGDSEANELVDSSSYSETSLHQNDSSSESSEISDCESGISGERRVSGEEFSFPAGNLIRLDDGNKVHDLIRRRFLASLGPAVGATAEVAGIHRNGYAGAVPRARLSAFQIFERAMADKCGGDANVKYAWYRHSSVDEIEQIVCHGFA